MKYLFALACFLLASLATSTNDSWDFFIFCTRWPGGECAISGSCIVPQQNGSFLIHGLWPQDSDGKYPSFCSGPAWNPNAVSSIENQLDEWWPNLQVGSTTPSFWDHEWTKHGTCAAPVFTSELPFFQQCLKLLAVNDYASILANAGIVPSDYNTYDPNDMANAIKAVTGYYPGLKCASEQSGSKSYLEWLGICYTKSFEYMDCPSNMDWTCPSRLYYGTTNNF